jgi:hypothetical protein
MLLKTVNVTLNVLVAVTVWSAALAFAISIAMAALHLLALGGLTLDHITNP